MGNFVADDVIAVLEELQDRFRSSRSKPDVKELRIESIRALARIEVEAGRFSNEASAENSIRDACSRRLGYTKVEEFDDRVYDWLQGRPEALNSAVLAKVTTEGQRKLLAEVLGISNSQITTPQAEDLEPPTAERVTTTLSRILRDTRLSNRVKALHNYECQICGFTLLLGDGSRYAEGHHIRPLGSPHDGPDIVGNIICVCPNHHSACDLGAIKLVGNELRGAVGHVVAQQYVDYHNSIIFARRNGAQSDAAAGGRGEHGESDPDGKPVEAVRSEW